MIDSLNGNLGDVIANGDHFGSACSCLGDLDGDGVLDAAVGAALTDKTTLLTNRGAVHILFLNADGTVKASHGMA